MARHTFTTVYYSIDRSTHIWILHITTRFAFSLLVIAIIESLSTTKLRLQGNVDLWRRNGNYEFCWSRFMLRGMSRFTSTVAIYAKAFQFPLINSVIFIIRSLIERVFNLSFLVERVTEFLFQYHSMQIYVWEYFWLLILFVTCHFYVTLHFSEIL